MRKTFNETHQQNERARNGKDEHKLQFEDNWNTKITIFLVSEFLPTSLALVKFPVTRYIGYTKAQHPHYTGI